MCVYQHRDQSNIAYIIMRIEKTLRKSELTPRVNEVQTNIVHYSQI